MKVILSLLLLCSAFSMHSQNAEVQKTIETFFEGFHARDTIKMHSVCSDKILLQSVMEQVHQAQLSNESVNEFYKSIVAIPKDIKFEERILNYSIQIDGAMAQVWAPYEFYINGKLSHSGVDAFTLFKENNQWKIIYLIDTRRK